MADKAKAETEIDLLNQLEKGDVVTQMSLAQRMSVSVGFINAILKRAINKGYVKVKAAPYKRYAYYVTPKGFREKSRLVAEYLEVSLDFFRTARTDYSTLFSRAKSCGFQKFVLVGDGELVEIAFLAAREVDVEIIGLYDRTTNTGQKHGLTVLNSLDEQGDSCGFVVTESRHPQEIFEELAARFDQKRIFTPNFMRVSTENGADATSGDDP